MNYNLAENIELRNRVVQYYAEPLLHKTPQLDYTLKNTQALYELLTSNEVSDNALVVSNNILKIWNDLNIYFEKKMFGNPNLYAEKKMYLLLDDVMYKASKIPQPIYNKTLEY
jgi:hypothetical protein